MRTSTAAFAAALTTIAPAAAPAAVTPAERAVIPRLTGMAPIAERMEVAARRIDRHQALVGRHVRLSRELADLRDRKPPLGVARVARRWTPPTLERRNEALERRVRATSGGAGGVLARIRACESDGDYSANTGNGYYGAYQFDRATWRRLGGQGLPSEASPGEQDRRARKLVARVGTSPWPSC